MQVNVEKVSSIERKLTISVPENLVEQAYERQMQKFAKNANIKGFRPGKAPLSYIQKRFGSDARSEALREVISEALMSAVKEQNLKPISQPHIVPKEMLAGQPFEFVATFEELPEISEVKFNLDKVEKLNVDIKDADVEHVITQLQKQHAKWNKVDREAQNKDRVILDYIASYEGAKEGEENKISNYSLELGSNTMIPGFEEGLLGAKVGEERKLNLHFPKDYSDTEKAGKAITFDVTIKEIYAAEIPEMDEKFIQSLGIKSNELTELKSQIQKSLTQERDRLVKEKLKEQIFSHVLEQNSVEVPKVLIQQESKAIHDEFYPREHDHSQHSPNEMSAFSEIAKKRVALSLLIGAYAKLNNIKADPKKVQERILEIASLYESPNEVIQWLSSEERKQGIESQVTEDQVLDKLMEGLPVTEKTLSYAELKGIKT